MSLLFVVSFYTGFGFGGKHEASKGAEKSTLLTSRRLPKISDYSVVFCLKSATMALILRKIYVDIVVCILSVS